jgi:hypothetical protein
MFYVAIAEPLMERPAVLTLVPNVLTTGADLDPESIDPASTPDVTEVLGLYDLGLAVVPAVRKDGKDIAFEAAQASDFILINLILTHSQFGSAMADRSFPAIDALIRQAAQSTDDQSDALRLLGAAIKRLAGWPPDRRRSPAHTAGTAAKHDPHARAFAYQSADGAWRAVR